MQIYFLKKHTNSAEIFQNFTIPALQSFTRTEWDIFDGAN